jgi:hypothetical protein
VLASVNGPSNSSVGGSALRLRGAAWFNPGEVSRRPQIEEDLSKDEADSLARAQRAQERSDGRWMWIRWICIELLGAHWR